MGRTNDLRNKRATLVGLGTIEGVANALDFGPQVDPVSLPDDTLRCPDQLPSLPCGTATRVDHPVRVLVAELHGAHLHTLDPRLL